MNTPTKPLLLAFLALVALVAALVIALGGGEPPAEPAPRAVEADAPVDPLEAAAPAGAVEKAPVEAVSSRVAVSTPAPAGEDLDPSVVAALAGFKGRVVRPDGTPAAGVRVELFRLDADAFLEDALAPLGETEWEPRIDAGSTVTGEDGRFAITGVAPSGFHLLLADAGGVDPTHRLIERSPGPGEVVDLGDVVLKNGATLVGRVVDEEGAPVAGALVRALDVPEAILRMVPLERFDPHGALIVREAGVRLVVQMPSWVERRLRQLPIASTTTAADGAFELAGVQPGRNVVVATAPGRLPVAKAGLKLAPGERREVGELRLREGEEVFGRVVDHDGRPVAGAEVLLGQGGLAPLDFAARAGPTDAEGRFTATGFRGGKVTGAARRGPEDAWVVADPVPVGQEVVIELPATRTLTVRVRSRANRPLEDLRFAIVAGPLEMAALGFVPPRELTERAERLEDGRYRLAGLPPGKQTLIVSAAGHAPATKAIDLVRDATELVELEALAPFTVLVTDRRGRPIAGARIFVHPQGREIELPLECGRTAADGRLPVEKAPAGEVVVTARHPAYGQAHARARLPVAEVRLVLETPGRLEGVLTEKGRPPEPGKWTILAEPDHRREASLGMPDLPRLARPDAKGEFRLEGLRPGRYTIRAIPSLGRLRSVGSLFEFGRTSWMTASDNEVEVEVVAEQTAHVRIEALGAATDASEPSARVTGTVTIDGAPGRGTVVLGWSSRRFVGRVGADGRFDLGRVPAGRIQLMVEDPAQEDPVGGTTTLWSGSIEVVAGKDLDVPIELRTSAIAGVVRLPDGTPAVGAFVRAMGRPRQGDSLDSMTSSQVVTDQNGRFRFARIAAGTYELTARHDAGRTRGSRSVEAAPGTGASGVELRLEATVRVRGHVDTSVFGATSPRYAWLSLQPEDGSGGNDDSAQIQRDGSFTVEGALPGTYRATIWARFPDGKGREYVSVDPVVVGARDVEGLQLRVQPKPETPPQRAAK